MTAEQTLMTIGGSPMPTGLGNKAHGCETQATLGQSFASFTILTGLRHIDAAQPQPRWGCADSRLVTQGSSYVATLGLLPESLQDSLGSFRKPVKLDHESENKTF